MAKDEVEAHKVEAHGRVAAGKGFAWAGGVVGEDFFVGVLTVERCGIAWAWPAPVFLEDTVDEEAGAEEEDEEEIDRAAAVRLEGVDEEAGDEADKAEERHDEGGVLSVVVEPAPWCVIPKVPGVRDIVVVGAGSFEVPGVDVEEPCRDAEEGKGDEGKEGGAHELFFEKNEELGIEKWWKQF